MWGQLYHALTTYPGMYLCYLLPIVYFFVLIGNLLSIEVKHRRRIRLQDLSAGVAIALIALDFSRYVYLWFTHTGRLLPFTLLLIKYALGGVLWVWVCWYSYTKYLNRRSAGARFAKRWAILIGCGLGGLVLALLGKTAS